SRLAFAGEGAAMDRRGMWQRCVHRTDRRTMAPAAVKGVDPSPAQLAFARTRPAARLAHFQQGDAMALPSADDSFDAAVMALVIFFVTDPAKGVGEMARVVRRGGTVAAYAWDMLGGGFPPNRSSQRCAPWPLRRRARQASEHREWKRCRH